jgi:hypothetical protein
MPLPIEARNGRPTAASIAGELDTAATLKDAYDRALEPFKAVAPSPVVGQDDFTSYARKAGDAARKILPEVSELKRVRFADLPQSALRNFTERMLAEVQNAAMDPETVEPGRFREITLRDADNNFVERKFIGPTSFVRDFSLPSRRVSAINAPMQQNLLTQHRFG